MTTSSFSSYPLFLLLVVVVSTTNIVSAAYCGNSATTCSGACVLSFQNSSTIIAVDGDTTNHPLIPFQCDPEYYPTSTRLTPGSWFTLIGDGGYITASTNRTAAMGSFDTQIAVLTGCAVSAGLCRRFNDDIDSNTRASALTWFATKGVQYWIFVTGFERSTGNFTLTISTAQHSTAPNSLCTTAQVVNLIPTLVVGQVNGDVSAAPATRGCHPVASNSSILGLWYLISGTSAALEASLVDPPTGSYLELYSKSCSLTE